MSQDKQSLPFLPLERMNLRLQLSLAGCKKTIFFLLKNNQRLLTVRTKITIVRFSYIYKICLSIQDSFDWSKPLFSIYLTLKLDDFPSQMRKVNNKFYISCIVLFRFDMRDQKYYQRLNQIREKYGYLNELNIEKDTKHGGYQRQSQPQSARDASFNNYQNNYEIPSKASFRQERPEREMQNKQQAVSPISNKNAGMERNYREKRPVNNPQEYDKHGYDNILTYRPTAQHYTTHNSLFAQAKQASSPIKKLLNEYSQPTTPRQQDKVTTPLRNNKEILKKSIQRLSYTPAPNKSQRPNIPPSSKQTNQYHPSSYNQSGPSKITFSINSIDKIQEKIQQALNRAKK